MGEFYRRIHYLLNRKRLRGELENDMAFHRAMLSRENRRDFGNPALLQEKSNAAWGWSWLEHFFQDLRFGARLLQKSPGLAITAIAVLALGIGVNVTAFNIVDVVFFKPLPVRDPQSIARFTTRFPQGQATEVAYPAAVFYAEHNTALSAMLAQASRDMTFTDANLNIQAGLVTGNYFQDLGSSAGYGPLFDPKTDEAPDAPPVAVLGYRFWQSQFGGDPAVIGKTIRLNQHPATVIGVTAGNFVGLDPEHGENDAVWLLIDKFPYFVPESKMLTSFRIDDSYVQMWGRLKPGVTFKAAEASLLPLAEELVAQHPRDFQKGEWLVAAPGGYAASLDPADFGMLPMFGIFSALVLLVLAVACGNLGNLVLSRVITREREIFIRLSLGAGRGRVFRQLMTESLLLALLGSAAGLFVSWLVSRPLVVWLGGAGSLPMAPDWRTTSFALGVAILACVLFGLPSARQALRSSQRSSRARTIFMTSQFAASCVLLIVSGLLLRALHRAITFDPGFDYSHTLTIDPHLEAHAYTPEKASVYLNDMRTRLAQVSGVQAVALVNNPPLGNSITVGTVHGAVNFTAYVCQITPGYFSALSIPLLSGRDFRPDEQDVAIVSQSFARKMWPGKDPLRQEYEFRGKKFPVIAVVGNARTLALRDSNAAEAYVPLRNTSLVYSSLLVRTSVPPEQQSAQLSGLARAPDPSLSPDVKILSIAFRQSLGDTQKMAGVVSFMGALALMLAVVGLYGVVSYNVVQRTREIGIRMALGATPSTLVRGLLAGLVRPLGWAIALGAALAAGLSMVLRSELYGVSNFDPFSYVGAFLLLGVTGAVAALLPARRALKVDPMIALRAE